MDMPRQPDGNTEGGAPPSSPSPASPPIVSPRVRLEVEILSADQAAPAPAPVPAGGAGVRGVLIVAADPDVRRYVRHCLRDRTDWRVLEASTVTDALAVAGRESADLLIVDAPEARGVSAMPGMRAVLMADDEPERSASGDRVSVLLRPFTAEQLVGVVARMLG
jgi:CheY-like chemotaxis protein